MKAPKITPLQQVVLSFVTDVPRSTYTIHRLRQPQPRIYGGIGAERTAKHLNALRKAGLVCRVGARDNPHWILPKKEA